MIYEILYNDDYLLRYLFHDDHTFDENTRKEVPPLSIIQQVFNGINKRYSWIVKGNQEGFEDNELNNAKIPIDDMFHIMFEKSPDKNTSLGGKKKNDNT